MPDGVIGLEDVRRDRPPRLDGLSGQQALELFIAAYLSGSARSELILRAMSDQQIEEAFSGTNDRRKTD